MFKSEQTMGRAKQLGDEHIIIVENPEVLTAEMVSENREECKALIAKFGGYGVIIIDISKTKLDFVSFVKIVRQDQEGARTEVSATSFSIIVGTSLFASSYRDAMSKVKSGRANMPVFSDLNLAIETARHHLAMRNNLDNLNQA